MNSHPPDIVSLAILTLGAWVVSPAVAQAVGPYIVIALGGLLGSAWSATRRDTTSVRGAFFHIIMWTLFSCMTAVPAAMWLGAWAGYDTKWFLGPVAIIIGGVGHDWPQVFRWGFGVVRSVIESKYSKAKNDEQQ